MAYEKELAEGKARLEAQDQFLRTTDTIPDDLWRGIVKAILYDSATPVSWAGGRLKIIYQRTQNGESISVPAAHVVLTKDTFEPFITEYFSRFMFEYILRR